MEANGPNGDGIRGAIHEEAGVIQGMSRVEPLRIAGGGDSGGIADGRAGVTLIAGPLVIRLPLEGVVDLEAEAGRLQGEAADCARNVERVERLVANPNFRQKARPDVVETEESRLAELRERQQRLAEILQQLGRPAR